jgi:hypothetical protein
MSFMSTQECSRLSNVAKEVERQKVRLIDGPVKLKDGRSIELWPHKAIAHLSHDGARKIGCGSHLQPSARRRSKKKDKSVPGDGGLLELVVREIGCKPNKAPR